MMLGFSLQLSVALTEKSTFAEHSPGSVHSVMVIGQSIDGGSLSVNVIMKQVRANLFIDLV